MKNLLTLSFLVICLNTFSQQPIFLVLKNGDLYSLDINNCTLQFKGSTGHTFEDIAFTPDGRLWGIDSLELYTIDTSNASVTFATSTTVASAALVALNDSILLLDSNNKLYRLNNINGTSYLIDSIGVHSSGDLTWYDNDLIMEAPFRRIVLDSTYTSVISVTAPFPGIPALGSVTVSSPEKCNAIVGLMINIYKINPFNGSYELLCPGINFSPIVWGAASMRLPVQSPLPTDCNTILSVEMISDQINKFELAPNPVYSSLSCSFESRTDGEFLFRIIDLLGRESKSEKIDVTTGFNKKTFDVLDLHDGIYVFQISDLKSGYMIQSKFLKTE